MSFTSNHSSHHNHASAEVPIAQPLPHYPNGHTTHVPQQSETTISAKSTPTAYTTPLSRTSSVAVPQTNNKSCRNTPLIETTNERSISVVNNEAVSTSSSSSSSSCSESYSLRSTVSGSLNVDVGGEHTEPLEQQEKTCAANDPNVPSPSAYNFNGTPSSYGSNASFNYHKLQKQKSGSKLYRVNSPMADIVKKNSKIRVGSHSSLIINHTNDPTDSNDGDHAGDDCAIAEDSDTEGMDEHKNLHDNGRPMVQNKKPELGARKESISDRFKRSLLRPYNDKEVLYTPSPVMMQEPHPGRGSGTSTPLNSGAVQNHYERPARRISQLTLSFQEQTPSPPPPPHSSSSLSQRSFSFGDHNITKLYGVPLLLNETQSSEYINNYLSKNKTKFQIYKRPVVPNNNDEPAGKESHESMEIATFPTDTLLSMLACLLNKIIQSNDHMMSAMEQERRSGENGHTKMNGISQNVNVLQFKGKTVPKITLEDYFHRIYKFCPTSNDVFVSLLVYFDRITKKFEKIGEKFIMDSYNIHRLIIAAITVSTKFFSDFYYTNSRYAKVGGLSLPELNNLELQILILCNFELIINVEDLQKYGDLLLKFCSK
ncbi:hypothetical protein ACO0RG_004113 [Hanseniaspora osmophila]